MDSFINLRFNRLVVLEFTGKVNTSRSKIYKCQCDCGNIKEVSRNKLKNGTKSCGCLKAENLHHESGKNNICFSGVGDISKTFWNRIESSARTRKKEFNITIEYIWDLFIKQDKKCNISGVNINLSDSRKDMYNKSISASLDRIDNTKGYIVGNVHWVHKDINYMKGKLTLEKLNEWCRIITEHNKNDSSH